jgi:hypothetical protein
MTATGAHQTARATRLGVVPYIIKWTSEEAGRVSELVIRRHAGRLCLDYRDATPRDREEHGILWARMSHARGLGRPEYAHTHPGRQRRAMERLRCQVCGKDADRDRDGWLFLGWRTRNDPATWPENALTVQPPLCVPCARVAVRLCPASKIFVPLRVADPTPWGVFGTVYRSSPSGWDRYDDVPYIPFGDEQLHAVLASQLVMQLRDVRVVPLP